MKLIFIFLMLHVALFSQTKKAKIKLLQYFPYCGGARPNKELKQTPNKATVYSNKKLIFISDQQKIDTLTTDKNGYLNLNLSYGTYFAFEPWKYYKKIPPGMQESNIEMVCLNEEWVKEDLKIVISKKTITVANNLLLPKCPYQFPCLIKKHLPN